MLWRIPVDTHLRGSTDGQPRTTDALQYIELAHNYCLLGATNEVLGDFVGVTRRTIRNWIATHLDFADAVRCGRAVVDAAVVRWLKKAGAKAETTREEVRRHALGKTVNAGQADLVLGRPWSAGIVRPAAYDPPRRRAGVLRNAGRSTLAGH
jgi:hypothetical protein